MKHAHRNTAENFSTTPSNRTTLITFQLDDVPAAEVFLCGDFNGWAGHELRMISSGPNRWEKRLTLPAGRYEYKFVVDGQWRADPQAPMEVPNVFGSTNSVAVVR